MSLTFLRNLLKKLICGLFIFWLGGLAPLIAFNPFAAHHHLSPYQLVLFETLDHSAESLPDNLATHLLNQAKQRLDQQDDLIMAKDPFSGLAHHFQSSLNQPLLFGAIILLILALYLNRLRPQEFFLVQSPYFPPPKKPPRLLPFG
jgi:hypothetical protein